ncbi:MAG: hypothetical protein WA952_20100 [Lewinella sp.]
MSSPASDFIAKIRSAKPGQRVPVTDNLTLFRVPKQRYRNGQSYAVHNGESTLLIDTVHAITRSEIDALLADRPASALLITHSDLLGQAFGTPAELSSWLGGVPVLIHSYDTGRHEGLYPLETNTPMLQDLDIDYYHVPGHTPGSTAYLHRPTGYLFTGDIIVGNNYEKPGQYFTHAPIRSADWDLYSAGWAKIPDERVTAVLPLHGQPSFGPQSCRDARTAGLERNRLMRE